MKDLFQRNPELKEIIAELKSELLSVSRPAEEVILDDVDIRKTLKVSKRTMANYRSNGHIAYSQHGNGKIYYKLSDVLKFINDNRIDFGNLDLNIQL